jgi:hypothetical protein
METMSPTATNSHPGRLFIDEVAYDVSNLLMQTNLMQTKEKAWPKEEAPQTPGLSEEFRREPLIQSRYPNMYCARPGVGLSQSLHKKTERFGVEKSLSFRKGVERSPSFRKGVERSTSFPRKKSGVERSHSFRKKNERLGVEKSASFYKKNERFGVERSQSFRTKHKIVEKERFGLKKAPPSVQPSYNVHRQELPRAQKKSPEEEKKSHEEEKMSPEEGPCDDRKAATVEIFPGVHEILRGSAETTLALQRGTITQVQCMCCTQEMQCIEDAAYFICPTCRVVGKVPRGIWGVGLGFVSEVY